MLDVQRVKQRGSPDRLPVCEAPAVKNKPCERIFKSVRLLKTSVQAYAFSQRDVSDYCTLVKPGRLTQSPIGANRRTLPDHRI